MEETAKGLLWLHEKGCTHGDLRPENLLVSDSHQILICDFGLSKLPLDSTAEALQKLGSHRYMAPERFKGIRRDTTTDIFAFGMTIAAVSSATTDGNAS